MTYESSSSTINEYGIRELQESDTKWNYEIRGKITDRIESTSGGSDFIIQVGENQTLAVNIDSDKLVEGKDVILKSRMDLKNVNR